MGSQHMRARAAFSAWCYALACMHEFMAIHTIAEIPAGITAFAMAWLGLAQLLLIGLLLAAGLLVAMMFHRLRHPPRRGYAWAVARGVPGDPAELAVPRAFEAITVPIDELGHHCAAWSITGDDPRGPVIIYTPGWGDAKIKVLERLPAMAPIASSILAWDPPGHGESPGACWLGAKEPAMIQHIARACVPEGKPVILWGHSLGGGAALAAGAGCPQAIAVVAEAPYRLPPTPAERVMKQAGLPWAGVGPIAYAMLGLRVGAGVRWNGFDRAVHAEKLSIPLLVVHGDQDSICPIGDGKAIASAAPRGELLVIPEGRHNDLWIAELSTAERVLGWAREQLADQR